jgi:hypothetical protein
VPHRWFEQPSIATMKGGMWKQREAEDDDGREQAEQEPHG